MTTATRSLIARCDAARRLEPWSLSQEQCEECAREIRLALKLLDKRLGELESHVEQMRARRPGLLTTLSKFLNAQVEAKGGNGAEL